MTAPVLDTPDVPEPPAGVPADVWGMRGVVDDYTETAEPMRPEQCEQALRVLRIRMARGVDVVGRLNEEAKACDREVTAAYTRGFLGHDGPQTEKRVVGLQAAEPAQEVADIAHAKLDYARCLLRALEYEVRVFQSVGASVRAAYAIPHGDGWS